MLVYYCEMSKEMVQATLILCTMGSDRPNTLSFRLVSSWSAVLPHKKPPAAASLIDRTAVFDSNCATRGENRGQC